MDTDSLFLMLFGWCVIMGALGAAIGLHKNRFGAGFFWGAFLGPIGWLLIWLGPTLQDRKKRTRPGNW